MPKILSDISDKRVNILIMKKITKNNLSESCPMLSESARNTPICVSGNFGQKKALVRNHLSDNQLCPIVRNCPMVLIPLNIFQTLF